MNPKTKLAVGDTRRISCLFLIVTIMNIVALVFEPWYEGWGTEDAWESGDYFDGILEAANVDTIVGTIKIILWILTIVCALACIILYFVSKKVEPSKEECDAAFKKSCDYLSDKFNAELKASNAQAAVEAAGADSGKAERIGSQTNVSVTGRKREKKGKALQACHRAGYHSLPGSGAGGAGGELHGPGHKGR